MEQARTTFSVNDITPENWRTFAACKGLDTNLFFPDRDVSHYEMAHAKAVCRSCVVRERCLTEALSMGEDPGGIWGGLTGRERRVIRSRRTERIRISPGR